MHRHSRAWVWHHRERIIQKWRRYRELFVIDHNPWQRPGESPPEVYAAWWFVEGRFSKMNSRMSGCRCAMHRAIAYDTRYHRARARREERRMIADAA